jgi:hypothetical protein
MPRWTAIYPGHRYVFVPDTPENRDLLARQVDSTGRLAEDRLATFGRIDVIPNATPPKPDSAVDVRRIRMWPYALRVTVRVYDPRGRLDEPVVRSVVHRFE